MNPDTREDGGLAGTPVDFLKEIYSFIFKSIATGYLELFKF
jgi:hypothetical protein